LIHSVEQYLADNIDRPKRTQALACAAFDSIYDRVTTRRLNDPSRDYPGDVQAFVGKVAIMSAEVRAKAVPVTEVRSFVRAVRAAGISRAFLVVIHNGHRDLPREALCTWAWSEQGISLTIIESVEELIVAVCAWANAPLEDVLRAFPVNAVLRLREIEASPASELRWTELVTHPN
jgi:hypothetical protein